MLRFYSIFHAPKVLLLSIEIIIIIIILSTPNAQILFNFSCSQGPTPIYRNYTISLSNYVGYLYIKIACSTSLIPLW